MNMDQYTKNRFKEFDDLSTEELLEKHASLSKEILETREKLEDKSISSEDRTDTYGDLKFLEEQLSYIEQILPPIPSKRKSR